MKLISTLNFKGGVGKTTVTWLLARYLVERQGKTVLVVDADPQMSLTTAVELFEESGVLDERFDNWHKHSKAKGATLYHILTQFGNTGQLSIPESPFYVHRPDLHLLPSDEEIYWYDLEAPRAKELRSFTTSFIDAINARNDLPKFDYCLADCPPAFNSLSFSVISRSDLVLVPVNPDVFASIGVKIMIGGLKERLKPVPPFVVFMNRAKSRIDKMTGRPILTKESDNFLNKDVALAIDKQRGEGVSITLLRDAFIPERKGIKDALAGRQRIPPDLETYFAVLWDEIEDRFFTTKPSIRVQDLSANALSMEYSELQLRFKEKRNQAVHDFVSNHSSGYLAEFIKVNNLPIQPKASKQMIEDTLIALLVQQRAITG